jgi:hypothetical protein
MYISMQQIIWLVVSTPLKNMKVSWDDYSLCMENQLCSTLRFWRFWATAGQPQRTLPLGVEPAHRPSKGRILAHLARWVRASLGELDQ